MAEKIWHKSYAPGVPKSIDYEKITISEALARSAEKFPDRTALNYMGRRISYKALNDMVNQFARALQDMGIKAGDKVGVSLPNIPQVIISNLAIFRIGAVSVQNNPLYTERELAYQLDDSDSRIIITLTLLVPRMQKIKSQTKLEKIVGCHIHSFLPFPKKQLFPFVKKDMYRKIESTDDVMVFSDLLARYPADSVEDQSSWEEMGAILYTGGTTGVSKGVMLSHSHLSSNVQQFVSWFPDLKPGEERLVGNFPVFHTAGFSAIQNLITWQAWENIMVPRPEAKINLDILKKYNPTFLPGVPTIFVGLLAEPAFRNLDFSKVKGFFSGAAPLAADTIRDLKEITGATMCEVYGSTEAGPFMTVTPWGGEVKPGTVGVPVPDTEIKIVDIENGEKELPIGEHGEIVMKGPQIMMGYYKKPEATAEVLKDGWFYSGDIGCFDEDGYLSITDRKKDMIIAGGYNIYPVELDNVLFDHPKILEACTIGVKDEYRGETVKAFVVVKEGERLTEAEVVAYCKENLAAYKIPKIIEFIDELPKSAVGKILRRKLKDMEESS
ncbi:MAG: long-chain fatty acid--CoA ligase [Deltaproteobacteria bacterium]|nr:long-chain fatty acid--CoA ligase [Deltaproteobacteria bacterium]MBW2613996.1 long-chain fatty acid--CoA ligase [Deltaproteobacteria bacterium]MBW2678234.1 long-chain fatty acid--CoA ligase [Deltaproteobacteria bacterium]